VLRPACLTAVLLLVLTAACNPPDVQLQGIGVENRTGQPVHVYYVVDGEENFLGRFIAGGSAIMGDVRPNEDIGGRINCTIGDLVARAEDGTELERLPPPVCDDDTWVVQGAGGG
jgi:hypothetical protein